MCCTTDQTTDLHSMTVSDGSTVVPDYHGCFLRRALDHKVRKLRKLLSADEDMMIELDRIVCRLMILALRSSRGRRNPPPTRWMQCKLLDLLTLAENTVERRKKRLIENHSLRAIDFDGKRKAEERMEKIRNDEAGKRIVDKYIYLVNDDFKDDLNEDYSLETYLEEPSIPSTTEILKNIGFDNRDSPTHTDTSTRIGKLYKPKLLKTDETKLERTQAWVEEDIEPYLNHDNFDNNSGDTDHSVSKVDKHKRKTVHKRRKSILDNFGEAEVILRKRSKNENYEIKNIKYQSSNTNIDSKASRKKVRYINKLFRNSSNKLSIKECKYHNNGYKIKRKKEHCRIQFAKPIPKSLIELCHPEICVPTNSDSIIYPRIHNNSPIDSQSICHISATEQSCIIDIITEDRHETIALRRTIGTDVDDEQETIVKSISGHINMGNFTENSEIVTDNVHSHTIFLNDLNEPSTSKGIRHNSTNAQCGTDTMHDYSVLSAATSFHGLPKTISSYNIADLHVKSSDFGTCMSDKFSYNTCIIQSIKSVGIRIRDSDVNLSYNKANFNAMPINADVIPTSNNNQSVEIDIRDSHKKITSSKAQILNVDSNNTKSSNTVTNKTLDIHNTLKIELEEARIRNIETLSSVSDGQNMNINNNSNDLTSTQINYRLSLTNVSKKNLFGIDIKRSNSIFFGNNHNLQNSFDVEECSTTVFVPGMEINGIRTDSEINPDTTKLLAPSNLENVDISNFDSAGNRIVPCISFLSSSSDLRINPSVSKEVQKLNANKYTRLKLCCGGVYVHCYKDKTVSEDVVFQGEWQKHRPKASAKKMPQPPSVLKKINDYKYTKKKIRSKENIISINMNTTNKGIKLTPKGPTKQVRNVTPTRAQSENSNTFSTKKYAYFVTPVPKVNKPVRNVTKIGSKITMSAVSSKARISYPSKNPMLLSKSSNKEGVTSNNLAYKSYIPPYLKRNLDKIKRIKMNEMNQKLDIVGTAIKVNKKLAVSSKKPVIQENEQIKKELLNFNLVPLEHVRYLVYRNDIENNGNTAPSDKSQIDNRSNVKLNDSVTKKPYSSPSQNSSTCSSPNSIATVRPSRRPKTSKKPSYISHKNIIDTSSSEITVPNKNKKIIKRTKTIKNPIDNNNKENVPQTSGQYNKDIERKNMGGFVRRRNNVFVAQVKKEIPSTVHSVSKDKALAGHKSNVDNRCSQFKCATALATPKKSSQLDILIDNDEKEEIMDSRSKNFLVLKSQKSKDIEIPVGSTAAEKVEGKQLLNEWLSTCNKTIIDSRLNITTTMTQIIEDILDFVDNSIGKNNSFDSETVILSCDDLNQSPEDSLSSSYKTVIESENNVNSTIIESDLENYLNRSFDTTLGDESTVTFTDTRLTVPDLDMISFKSNTPVSKFSEYFLAENELNNNSASFSYHGSVHDIFERKNEILPQDPPGALALQLFSGFSLNAEPIAGDRPNPANLIDSETGSIAVENLRLATSEELFVSGRSSGSYETCLLDQDSVVPNWLFRIINQQQSSDEDEAVIGPMLPEAPGMLPVSMNDPIVDDNGNVLDPVLGVGAGDGRGMHSDSSGRGTSLSSTDTSSGQQSEAVLIDPFTGQMELLRQSSDSAIVIPNFPDGVDPPDNGTNQGASASNASDNRHSPLNVPNSLFAASDFDADISSLDTDIPDSSEN